MRKLLLALIVSLLPSVALAQNQGNVTSSGVLTPGHAARWLTTGAVIGDAGGAAGSNKQGQGYLTELGITNTGAPFCINDALTNAQGGYHRACFGANSLGGFLISYDAIGGAAPLNGQVCFNGTCYGFPPTGNGNILGPNSSVVNDLVAFNNTLGTLVKDTGTPMQAVQKGRMIGFPSTTWSTTTSSTTAWVFVTPLGSPAFTCASTTTQCLQEALTYRATNDISMEVFCYGGNTGYFNLASNITTGVIRQDSVLFHGCLANFASNLTGDIFKIDTMLDGARFVWDGQIACSNNSPSSGDSCVALHPTTVPPFEGAAGLGIFNSTIEIGAVSSGSGAATPAGSAVSVNADTGSTSANFITIMEINCAGSSNGASFKNAVEFKGATPTTGVFWNPEIKIGRWHQCINGVFENTTNATNYNNNKIVVGAGNPNATSSTGVGYDITGNGERLEVGVINNNEGAYKYGFKFESGATQNTIKISMVGQSDAAGYVDSGATSKIVLNQTEIYNAGVIFNVPPVIGGGLVGNLPGSPSAGQIAYVTDASSASEGLNIAGGGTNKAFLGWDGANWRVWGPTRQQGASDLSNGTTGSGAVVLAAAPTLTGVLTIAAASDATHTDATLCRDTTSGNVLAGSGSAGICLGTSSLRFKQNVADLKPGLASVMGIKPISYEYKPGYGSEGVKYGFAAEQMEGVLPQLVGLDNDGKPNAVDWAGLVPVLVKAIQEQQVHIDALQHELDERR